MAYKPLLPIRRNQVADATAMHPVYPKQIISMLASKDRTTVYLLRSMRHLTTLWSQFLSPMSENLSLRWTLGEHLALMLYLATFLKPAWINWLEYLGTSSLLHPKVPICLKVVHYTSAFEGQGDMPRWLSTRGTQIVKKCFEKLVMTHINFCLTKYNWNICRQHHLSRLDFK